MKTRMQIPLSNPDITQLERDYVLDVLKTPQLSLGPKLGEFESAFAEYVGSRHAVAVNSGTSGLHLVVRSLGIGDGDTVITTPFSFIASANCILFERARPVFVDIDPVTYNIDPAKVAEKIDEISGTNAAPPKAVLPVHVFGYPCDMSRIMEIAAEHGLDVIEDSCEALGTEADGRKAGRYGAAGVFAFYPNKQMTTGEGGVIVTDDADMAALCRSMRNQGRGEGGGWLAHERLGYNYRLSDINCALGLAQLERIEEIIAKRARVAEMYAERLGVIDGITLPPGHGLTGMSWFVYVVRLDERYSRGDRDRLLQGLQAEGIGCSNYFTPIHLQPFYRKSFGYKEGDFPVTEMVSERTIALPFHNNLTDDEIGYVAEKLAKLL